MCVFLVLAHITCHLCLSLDLLHTPQDGDGCITAVELGTVMRSLGQFPTDEELRQMIDESDTNHDGVIDFQEFLDMVRRQEIHQTNEPDIGLEAFKVFDVDGDGFITAGKLCRESAAFFSLTSTPCNICKIFRTNNNLCISSYTNSLPLGRRIETNYGQVGRNFDG